MEQKMEATVGFRVQGYGVIVGLYWGNVRVMENQMEKKMENQMETVV